MGREYVGVCVQQCTTALLLHQHTNAPVQGARMVTICQLAYQGLKTGAPASPEPVINDAWCSSQKLTEAPKLGGMSSELNKWWLG